MTVLPTDDKSSYFSEHQSFLKNKTKKTKQQQIMPGVNGEVGHPAQQTRAHFPLALLPKLPYMHQQLVSTPNWPL